MNVIVVGYMGFDGPGVMHAHHFANCLVEEGHAVLLLVNGDKHTVALMSDPPRYRLEQLDFDNGFLAPHLLRLATAFSPQIVHIWTPRHVPARAGIEIAVETGAPLVIHFEDDEEFVLRHFGGNARFASDDVELYRLLAREALDPDKLGELAPTLKTDFLRATAMDPSLWPWLHPVASAVAVRFADAFTVISQSYKDALEIDHRKPSLLLYPGVDQKRFAPRPAGRDLRERLGLQGRTVLLYSGAIANIHDFPAYMKALPEIVDKHPDVILVHLGRNTISDLTDSIVKALCLSQHVLFVGAVPHHQMPDYLATADAFLAPVRHDDFNEHRLPSKIPEYMSVGRPMLIMDWGFGRMLDPGDGVAKVRSDEPGEIAGSLLALLERRDHWPNMGSRLREKASVLFDWNKNTKLLSEFYGDVLDRKPSDRPEGLEDPTSAFTKDTVGFRTAKDGSTTRHVSSRTRRRVLVLSDSANDPQARRLDTRCRHLAQALSSMCDVAIGRRFLGDSTVEGVEVFQWSEDDPGPVLEKAERADVVLLEGNILNKLPSLLSVRSRRAVDLFGCLFSQAPSHANRKLPLQPESPGDGDALRVLRDQLDWGDFFLCATERQRDLILGMLTAMNRLDPGVATHGAPEGIVALVPQGIAEGSSEVEPGSLRSLFPGISQGDVVLVWGVEMTESSDPVTVIRGMAPLASEHPEIKLLLFTTNGVPVGSRQSYLWAQAKTTAEIMGLAGRSVFFAEADVGGVDKSAYLHGADVGVSAHFMTLETYFSFKTELLDYIEIGLPILTSRGDFFGALVEQQGLGRVVTVDDPEAWTEAIRTLAGEPEELDACRRRILAARESWSWSRVVQPLLAFCLDDCPSLWQIRSADSEGRSVEELANGVSTEGPSSAGRRRISLGNLANERALRAEVKRLSLATTALEARYQRTLEMLRVAEVQIGLLRKVPLLSTIWRTVRRWRYPGLRG